jgi:hypothetical protein
MDYLSQQFAKKECNAKEREGFGKCKMKPIKNLCERIKSGYAFADTKSNLMTAITWKVLTKWVNVFIADRNKEKGRQHRKGKK